MQLTPGFARAGSRSRQLPLALLSSSLLLLLLSLIPPLVRVWSGRSLQSAPVKTLNEYTFVGNDYPPYYPLDLGQVSLTPENTVHYQIDTGDASREWASIFPSGGGFLLLGPQRRPFGLTLFHQMHCLVRIRDAMRTGDATPHVHHCFNYLRQTVLCDADPALEPILTDAGGRTVVAEAPRACRDWTEVYELVAANYEETRDHERRRAEAVHLTYV